MQTIVERAKDLAYRAHAGQVDKADRPYIEHVARVAAAVADDSKAEAVAWMHDVAEDHPEYWDEIRKGFPYEIVRATYLLDRGNVSAEHYYWLIAEDDISLRVKLADIADNADESRLALLDEKTANRLRRKYAKAHEALADNA